MAKACGGPRTSFKEVAEYKNHRDAVRNIKKRIDNNPPVVDPEKFFRSGDYKNDFNRVSKVEEANRGLVQRINVIYRTKGKVDNGPRRIVFTTTSNYSTRLINNKKIECANVSFLKRLENAQPQYENKKFEKEYQENLKRMILRSKHPDYYKKKPITKEWSIIPSDIDKSLLCPQKRVRCFLDVEVVNEQKLGRLAIEVYRDIAPMAGENFIAFCKGYNGYKYKGSPLHRIVPDLMYTGGDIVNKSGTGGSSIYDGKNFPDENHILKFAGPGVLSTYNFTQNENNSQFIIVCQELETLNGRFVVFGRIVQGLRILQMIGEFGTPIGKPIRRVIISDCGVVE